MLQAKSTRAQTKTTPAVTSGPAVRPELARTLSPRGSGNQAALWMREHAALQTKLRISQPADPAEQEADQVAERVVKSLSLEGQPLNPNPEHESNPIIHRKCAACEEEEKTEIHRKCRACEEEESELFRKSAGGAKASRLQDVDAVQAELGPGRPLDPAVRHRMESAFGADFSPVRVHDDSAGARVSDGLNARAFTLANRIGFASGEYRPGSAAGDTLLAHELAHVVQQGHARPSSVRTAVPASRAAIHRQASDNRVVRIEILKPDTAVMYTADGETFATSVRESCDPAPGSYRVKVSVKPDSIYFEELTPSPPCRLKGGNVLVIEGDESAVVEDGSEIAITITAASQNVFKALEGAGGVQLDPGSRAKIAKILHDHGITEADFFEFMKAGGVRARTTGEMIDALNRFVAERETENLTSLQTANILSEKLFTSEGQLADRKGLDSSMAGIYQRYLRLQNLQQAVKLGKWGHDWLKKHDKVTFEALPEDTSISAFADTLKEHIEKDLLEHDIAGIPEFEARVAAFETSFREGTVNLATSVLKSADRICERFLVESAKFDYTNRHTERARIMMGALDPIRPTLVKEIDEANAQEKEAKHRLAAAGIQEAQYAPFLGDERKAELENKKKEAQAQINEAERREAAADDLVAAALPKFPFVAWPDFPKEKLLKATDPDDVNYWIDWYLIKHRNGIQGSLEQLRSNSHRIYKLDLLIGLSKQQFGIADGSIFDLIIGHEVEEASKESAWEQLKTALMFALLIVSIVVPGGVAVAAAVGTAALSASQAYDLYNQYYQDLAVHDANLSSVDPSQFWVIVAIIGAGMDAQGAISLLSKSSALRKAMQEFQETRKLAPFRKEIESLEGLSQAEKDAVEQQAAKHVAEDVSAGKTVESGPGDAPGTEPAPNKPPADTPPAPHATPEEEIESLGEMSTETTEMLEQNQPLRESLADSPLAAEALKHCSKFCFPPNMSPGQVRRLEQHLQAIKQTGKYNVQDINRFLYENRDNLEGALSDLMRRSTAEEMDAFLKEARNLKRPKPPRPRDATLPKPKELEKSVVTSIAQSIEGRDPLTVFQYGDRELKTVAEDLVARQKQLLAAGKGSLLPQVDLSIMEMGATDFMKRHPDLWKRFDGLMKRALREQGFGKDALYEELTTFLSQGKMATRRPDAIVFDLESGIVSLTDPTIKLHLEKAIMHEFKTSFYGYAVQDILGEANIVVEAFEHNPRLGIHRPAR